MAAWAIRLLQSPELASSIARNAYEDCAGYKWETVREKWLAAYVRLAGRESSVSSPVVAGQMIHDDLHP
jgi:hypothetical protein